MRWQPVLDGVRGKSPRGGARRGVTPPTLEGVVAPSFLFPVTSRPNSSPTEVATVPLAIKITLGHATLPRASVVGNKRSGAGRNDANNWVLNLEQPPLWFRQETGPVHVFRREPYRKISNKGAARNYNSSPRAFNHSKRSGGRKMACGFFLSANFNMLGHFTPGGGEQNRETRLKNVTADNVCNDWLRRITIFVKKRVWGLTARASNTHRPAV